MEALRSAFGQLVAFLPTLLAGLVVLAVGWLIAMAIRGALRAVLPRVGFDRFLARHRLSNRAASTRSGSHIVASVGFWVVMLVALMQASNIWGLTFVATGIAQVIGYLPNALAAAVIFGAAWVVGNWVGDRLRASTAERPYATILPGAVRAGILTVGAFVALRQLRIAPEILVIGFTLVFGAIAVAAALAFGLGARHTAGQMTQDWYEGQRKRFRTPSTSARPIAKPEVDSERPTPH